MATYTEPKYLSDVLLVEVAQGWTKQQSRIATMSDLEIGTVLSRVGEMCIPVDFNLTDQPIVVLASPLKADINIQKCVVIARGATVAKSALVWPEGATEIQINEALAKMEAAGIVAQDTY